MAANASRPFQVLSRIGPVQRDHTSRHDSDLQQFARGQNRIAMRMLAKHSAEHAAGDREIRRPEKYPRDADRAVSSEPGENANR